MLGLDPLYVANEGVLVAIVPAEPGPMPPSRYSGPIRSAPGRRDRRSSVTHPGWS